jgi:hypothetical protein
MLSRRQQSGHAVASAVLLRLAERLREQPPDAFGPRRNIRLLAAPFVNRRPCFRRQPNRAARKLASYRPSGLSLFFYEFFELQILTGSCNPSIIKSLTQQAGRQGVCTTEAALTKATMQRMVPMADSEPTTVTIPLNLPRHEANAFAAFLKRTTHTHCVHRSNRVRRYPDGRPELEVMWSAVQLVEAQFAEAGFAPR